MKICKIILKGFQQFQDFTLDLTNPETGEPLEKVCFIGRNGTGKTTLLEIIGAFLQNMSFQIAPTYIGFIIVKFKQQNQFFYWMKALDDDYLLSSDADEKILIEYLETRRHAHKNKSLPDKNYNIAQWDIKKTAFRLEKIDTIVYVSSEINFNAFVSPIAENGTQTIYNVPKTNLNEAVELFKKFPIYHKVSTGTITNFWKILIFNLKKREEDYLNYLNTNKHRTVGELEKEFNENNKSILKIIKDCWNPILELANLEFDIENAQKPTQLTDNLLAFIRNKTTKEEIPYYALSEGIRSFIFKIGYIRALYFSKNIQNSFLLIDEPENSLYPDFLYNFVENQLGFIENTQTFIATHSEIIASQFEPYERVILEFDEQGYVQAHRGIAPIGDDANDILEQDFATSVYNRHPKAQAAWEKYLSLLDLIANEDLDKATRKQYVKEYLHLGNLYNFPAPNEIR